MALEGMQIGNYRLVRLIGSGGMGEVYFAEDTRIARRVAVKVVRNEAEPYPNAQATKDAMRLFEREMKAITTLDHPNILPLFDFGEQTINRTAFTYMVMPFRSEGSLVDWLHQQNSPDTLPPQEVVHIINQAAGALQHAHNHNLMHLDVKPSNFLIRLREDHPRFPDVLLADFGIAKFNTATATASQSIRGTPAYMAPEQWAGNPVAATDQYALAIMTYQLLNGRSPFQGNLQQAMYQHFQVRPQPPSTFNPRLSPTVDSVILRALEKRPEDRFPSVQAFAAAFEQACQGERTVVQPPPPTRYGASAVTFPAAQYAAPAAPWPPLNAAPSNIAPPPPMQYIPPGATALPEKKPFPWWIIAVVLGMVILLGGGSFGVYQAFHKTPSVTPTPSPTPQPAIPHLKSSYSGTTTRIDLTPNYTNPQNWTIDSQDPQGNLTVTVINPKGYTFSCHGTVNSAGKMALQCVNDSVSTGLPFNFTGAVYPDGHIEGTQVFSDGETFKVQLS